MRARVAEGSDDFEELDHTRWPAVREDQREGVRLLAADVEEVDCLAVDHGRELRIAVEHGFLRPPVEAVAPVGGQLSDEAHALSAAPVVDSRLRPARSREPRLEIGNLRLADR